uniref:NAC domain-containing protein n=1 Tax=Leersia perrieri TaxID=77586 RepID=A0A0D9VWE8_9ORYZ
MAADLTFCPRDHELITKFLRPRIADATVKFPNIHDADAVLDAGGRRVGHLRKLSYGVREKGDSRRKLTRLGWCMTEFGVDDRDAGGGGGGMVLCKMYRSPRAGAAARGAEARQSATAAAIMGSKRKAAADGDVLTAAAARLPSHWTNHAAGVKEEEETFVPAAPAQACGGGIVPAAPCPATPTTAPAPASVGGGDVAMELPAPPEGEFTWDKELTWIQQVLLS